MNKNIRGFTLLETVVVMAIIGILSLFAVENIIEFQRSSLLDNTVNEFASLVRNARTKSLAGELPPGTTAANFISPGILPVYGVRVQNSQYILFSEYRLTTDAASQRVDIQNTTFDNKLQFNPASGELLFSRVTGSNLSAISSFTLSRIDGQGSWQIQANDQGIVTSRL